jgi:hypothetical protein
MHSGGIAFYYLYGAPRGGIADGSHEDNWELEDGSGIWEMESGAAWEIE